MYIKIRFPEKYNYLRNKTPENVYIIMKKPIWCHSVANEKPEINIFSR